jgi:hypothetical protein
MATANNIGIGIDIGSALVRQIGTGMLIIGFSCPCVRPNTEMQTKMPESAS